MLLALASLFLLASCATGPTVQPEEQLSVATGKSTPVPAAATSPIEAVATTDKIPGMFPEKETVRNRPAKEHSIVKLGTGRFVGPASGGDSLTDPYVLQLASVPNPYPMDELPRGRVYSTHRVYSRPFLKDGETWYRLRLGFFKTREAAQAALKDVQEDFPGAWITRASFGERQQGTEPLAAGSQTSTEAGTAGTGDIILNFEAASMREFLRVVFEEILGENYLVDPQVKGTVTLHTTYPLGIDLVLQIVETVLQLNGAALVQDQGLYKIVPLANAEAQVVSPVIGKQPARGAAAGYGVQIVPLRYVAASEMEKIIKPFVPKGSQLRIDTTRNLLILSGPQYRINQLLETIRIFDVDWLAGMSFGMFPLRYAEAATLVGDIRKVIGAEGETPLAGIVRLEPIERLNAIMVITHHPDHLTELRNLIEHFDLGAEGAPGRRLYVYHIKNGKAENIAGVLQQLFGQTQSSASQTSEPGIQQLPPGQGANVFRRARELSEAPPPVGAPGAGGDYPQPAAAPILAPGAAQATDESVMVGQGESQVAIMADQDNNAVLVMASPADYRMIEAAIRKLDIPPRQVLINAIIAEVTLNDDLNYGVQWFLKGNHFDLGFNAPLPAAATGQGLAMAVFNGDNETRLFFDVLNTVSAVKFMSAPQIMVRDNQTATIRVGDQIPVTTRSSQSTTDPDAPIVTEVQYRDTGTLLTVLPRINAGGQVTLDISQEVSLPGTEPAVGGGGNVSIAQRTIDSMVTVQSGQTIVLGGLIRETATDARSGIPLLMDIPWLGKLFSSTQEVINRTELIVTVTPTVVENQQDVEAVTDELRLRMKKAAEYQDTVQAQ